MKRNIFILPALIILLLFGCTDRKSTQEEEKSEMIPVAMPIEDMKGNYVSEEYAQRADGYDWMVATVTPVGNDRAYILIRSRADRKKPTCTFEGLGTMRAPSTLKVEFEGKGILFNFTANTLDISTEKEEDSDFPMYFCSGGGNFTGSYRKLDEPLDESQLEPSGYNQSLSLQGITFDIHASDQGSMNLLMITPSGLEIDNQPVLHEIDGNVTDSQIEDLNSDGSPEVLVYISSAGSGSYGSVVGYSVNNKKSMSQIYLPPITDDPELSKGYMGHDDFTTIETSFSRRFPIYKEGDSNSNPTGGIRQIQYKLVEGENSRVFEVVNVYEFPSN